MAPDLGSLIKSCDRYRPHLIATINMLLEGGYSHTQQPQDALRGHVCGRATRVLSYLLNSEGYDVRAVKTNSLGGKYPSQSHEFLVVDLNKETIVDAAYYQFINVFFLDKEQMPKEDILIVPYEKLDEKIKEFVRLRNLKVETHPEPQILKEHSDRFSMSDERLRDHFRRVWDYKAQIYSPSDTNGLAEDIERLNRGETQAVSGPTIKVVDYLKKHGLIK